MMGVKVRAIYKDRYFFNREVILKWIGTNWNL